MTDMVLCPECDHAKRRHSTYGCMANGGACTCSTTPAQITGEDVPAPPVAEQPAAEDLPAAAVEPAPVAPRIEVKVEPRTDGSRSPVESVLNRAVLAGGRHAKRAEKIREQVIELDGDLAEYERVADAEKRVEKLRAALAKATEDLRTVRRPGPTKAAQRGARSASAREVREWAQKHNIPCSLKGIVPAAVMQAYRDAHAEVG